MWDWRATAAGNKVFVSISQWPNGSISLPAMKAHITRACLLAEPHHLSLKFSQSGNGIQVQLPANAADPVASVLVLETRS